MGNRVRVVLAERCADVHALSVGALKQGRMAEFKVTQQAMVNGTGSDAEHLARSGEETYAGEIAAWKIWDNVLLCEQCPVMADMDGKDKYVFHSALFPIVGPLQIGQ